MQMRMLLLLPTVVLVVSLTVASTACYKLNKNLNSIIENAEKYNESSTKEYFVEDVSHLAEGKNRCQNVFFCKVHKILVDHENLPARNDQNRLLRDLRMYINENIKNCTELLKNVTSTGVSKPIPDLMGYLITCIRTKNLNN